MSRNDLSWEDARRRAELISDVRYRVHLDLTEDDGFRSETHLSFRCSEPGAETFVDLTAPELLELTVNGEERDPSRAFDGNRVALTGLGEDNEVRVVARCAYNRTEVGLHHFVDPADGNVYVHTHLEPFGCHRVFACFDQPDVKATFDVTVQGREGWEIISNGPVASRDGTTWTFATTPRIPTYITAVCAGPYRVWRDTHRGIDLGLYCRQSLAQFFEPGELFEVTKQGFDFFEPAFGHRYPFLPKYDQVFIPESNSGAMENAACVTFNDIYVFRSRMTDAARERRAETILHEMAHMWFGDLVTMRWWNDLWLNESFASYMAVLSEAEGTRWTEAWTTFADSEKTWALRQDQLPTTHPIVADVPDVESVHLNFDGISYAKGASVLKQLAAWVGRDRFFIGLHDYCERHGLANATLDDFLAALERSSGRDLHAWSKQWLETAGVNTLRPRFTTEERDGREVFASFSVLQEAPDDWPTLRSHRLGIGLWDAGDRAITKRGYVELDVDGEATDVPELVGEPVPDLTLLNDTDLTFAKIRLDERSLATVVQRLGDVEDSLARTLCWTACWDMTRDGEMRARDYLRLVIRNIGRESKIGVVQSLLAQASSAVHLYGDPANREAAKAELTGFLLSGLREADPGSDHQLAWARAFIAAASSQEDLAIVRRLLEGDVPFDGLAVDTELRWAIVRGLAAAGADPEGQRIAAEEAGDRTDRGARHAAAARAARPSPEAKSDAWRIAVEASDLPLALVDEVMAAFHQFGQEDLLRPYVDRFFEEMPRVWEEKDLPDALAFGRRMYPFLVVDRSTVAATDRYLAQAGVPGPVRRMLLEGKDGIERVLRAREADARA